MHTTHTGNNNSNRKTKTLSESMIWGVDKLLGRSTLSHCRRFYPEEGRTPFPSPKTGDCSTTSFHVAQYELGGWGLGEFYSAATTDKHFLSQVVKANTGSCKLY